MHAHAPRAAQRFLRPPGLLFHARPRIWSQRPDLHRHGQSRPAGFESAVFPNFTTPRKMVRTEGMTRAPALGASPHAYGVPVGLLASRTLMDFRPSAPRADASTVCSPRGPEGTCSAHPSPCSGRRLLRASRFVATSAKTGASTAGFDAASLRHRQSLPSLDVWPCAIHAFDLAELPAVPTPTPNELQKSPR